MGFNDLFTMLTEGDYLNSYLFWNCIWNFKQVPTLSDDEDIARESSTVTVTLKKDGKASTTGTENWRKTFKKSHAAGQSPKSLNIMKLPSFAPTYPSKGELPFKTEIPLIISLLIVLPSVMGLILDVSWWKFLYNVFLGWPKNNWLQFQNWRKWNENRFWSLFTVAF